MTHQSEVTKVKRGILYCTYNGVCNNTNGIGRQTKTLLGGMDKRRADIESEFGSFALDVAFPAPGSQTLAYNEDDLLWAQRIVKNMGGRLFGLPSGATSGLWSVDTWEALSKEAAEAAIRFSKEVDELAVIAVDTPFAGVSRYIADSARPYGAHIKTVHALYSTDAIHGTRPTTGRRAWEQECIEHVNGSRHAWVADIGQFFTSHLRDVYGLRTDRLIPFRSSLDLASCDLQACGQEEARRTVAKWGVPTDRPIVLSFGRADPIKGVDTLIRALGPLRDQVHLALVAVPYSHSGPILDEYRRLIAEHGVRATLVPRFTRELPRALCALEETRIVACTSLGEPLANVPFEVAMWARNGGPVVVAPACDGFLEQIEDGQTGLFYAPTEAGSLTDAIRRALNYSIEETRKICQSAHEKVARDRDIVPNLVESLHHLWGRRL
ncbi:glycosyltransferase family 4 protein [Streptomyces sp. S.PNR 29]|uniref:glycosyltransferase family 4 protein n=1 Tax=Streptomyces sp. S.PNR 29 TaxID=2973805 RepID=UPI0025AFAAB2|nr:glycosyltransferase family 4 protein [Streptomyces sp. S.PNR 29]MDN0194364.1 glycosyltransferase family 4 protein [Streptomyces sp. S.PNR 29]